MIATPAAIARLRRSELLLDAAERQRPRRRLIHAGQHLEQRRFARAVFAHQAMHFAAPHFQRHRVEREHAGKRTVMPSSCRYGSLDASAAAGEGACTGTEASPMEGAVCVDVIEKTLGTILLGNALKFTEQ